MAGEEGGHLRDASARGRLGLRAAGDEDGREHAFPAMRHRAGDRRQVQRRCRPGSFSKLRPAAAWTLIHCRHQPATTWAGSCGPDACLCADSGLFLNQALADADQIRRPCDDRLVAQIAGWKANEARANAETYSRCGVDPGLFVRGLRAATCRNALTFVDVTVSQYWATETFTATQPRTFFNPTNNQAMGWSIGAALGANKLRCTAIGRW